MNPGDWIVVGMLAASVLIFLFMCCCHIAAEGKGEDE